jgi:hypothetical protein
MYLSGPPGLAVVEHSHLAAVQLRCGPVLEKFFGPLRSNSMSKEKPNEDPHQQTDWKNTKQTDQPWKGPVEREQRNEDRINLEKWHYTNTH